MPRAGRERLAVGADACLPGRQARASAKPKCLRPDPALNVIGPSSSAASSASGSSGGTGAERTARGIALIYFLMFLITPSFAADSLASWAKNFDQPKVQQTILNRIFPGQMGSIEDAKKDKNGTYYFLKNGHWVRLGGDIVYSSYSVTGPYLVVSCMMYRHPTSEPITAAAYLFRDVQQRPTALSAGYAAHEQVQEIRLPGLRKKFLLLMDSSRYGTGAQWNAFLLELDGTDYRPRTVWNSPMNARDFGLGFTPLGGKDERLVFRSLKAGDYSYKAYRWNGTRFEEDSFVFESKLKALPEEVWEYETGR